MDSKIYILFDKFCPDVLKLIDYAKWEELDERFEKQNNLYEEKLKKLNLVSIQVKTNLVNLLVQCNYGDKISQSFISFLNGTVKELVKQLNDQQKKRLGNNAKGMLLNLNDLNYLSFFGEACTLKLILDTKKYELIQIEALFPNGKTKDFKIKNLYTGKEFFVEVLNIQLGVDKLVSEDIMRNFLLEKLKAKITEETKNIKNTSTEFLTFLPVLWCFELEKLQRYENFFVNFERNLIPDFSDNNHICGFTSFAQIPNSNGYYSYSYQYVTKLIDEVKN